MKTPTSVELSIMKRIAKLLNSVDESAKMRIVSWIYRKASAGTDVIDEAQPQDLQNSATMRLNHD